ncbi:hypothetical protein [Olivibacter sp. XZL3]|uniref:hypothetical protein n=1 Tax=Olivibacter sp. XZL3 TaxID=1735116 RepID=UPI00106685B1|nr:hypothetical protein [Olivibacter sp. XZL3]
MKEITERIKSPTPMFFKKIRTIGLIFGAIGGVLLTYPITLPTIVVAIDECESLTKSKDLSRLFLLIGSKKHYI